MAVSIKWLGHATFLIESDTKTFLIDPFLNDNPAAPCSADDVHPDVILLTHGHGDHVADAVEIAKRTQALVISNFEIGSWLEKKGVKNAHAMHIGGQHEFDFGTVQLTIAHHGSQLPDGSDGGNPAGIVLNISGVTIYHAGDTGLFLDMQLIGEEGIDVAILPIGDNYTMGPKASLRAIEFLKPRHVFQLWNSACQAIEIFVGMVVVF